MGEAARSLDASPAEGWASALLADGYCVIPGLVDAGHVAALHDDLRERFERTPFCVGDFYGERTKRFGAALKRSPRAAALIAHPLILQIAERVLGAHCDCIQLNLAQAVEIHPGEAMQPPHRDQDMWGGPKGQFEYLINVMWPFTPYTADNGATRLWPGSHGAEALRPGVPGAPVAAEMEPGSVLLFLGSVLHCGGANVSSAPRTGLITGYSLGWLKPYENPWLAYPPEVARGFAPEVAALAGYRQHRPNLGNYEGRCPSVLLTDEPADYLAAVDALRPDQLQAIARFKGGA
ncbi:phytanoyl-CoA dioxygenase family protein [Phenylobacterium sp.]|uniref:phytanoyl-CoA dioxygenase family protein n=1 Tax=Phenylobacterium sp. TaxID=1871053 RepID=UPI0035B3C767